MKKTLRPLFAAIAAAALFATAIPATAGPAEAEFLARLQGIYEGSGKITGGENGTVTCRLTIRQSQEVAARLLFNGRCAFSGGTAAQSFNGIIRYNDETRTYESSSQGHTITGRRSGSSLTFVASGNDTRGRGSSTMVFSPGSVNVQFEFTDTRTGQASKGTVPFRRT